MATRRRHRRLRLVLLRNTDPPDYRPAPLSLLPEPRVKGKGIGKYAD